MDAAVGTRTINGIQYFTRICIIKYKEPPLCGSGSIFNGVLAVKFTFLCKLFHFAKTLFVGLCYISI